MHLRESSTIKAFRAMPLRHMEDTIVISLSMLEEAHFIQ